MFRKIVGKCPVCGDPAWITSFFAKKAFCTNDPEHRPQLVLGWHSPHDLAAPPAPEPTAAPADDLERECADADRICAALGLTVEQSRTDGGSLNVPRIIAHISETLTALRESHAFGVAMTDKYIASQAKTAPEPTAALAEQEERAERAESQLAAAQAALTAADAVREHMARVGTCKCGRNECGWCRKVSAYDAARAAAGGGK